MSTTTIITLAVLFVLGQFVLPLIRDRIGGKSVNNRARIQAKPILTDNEREFFQRLQQALPTMHVFPQVAANAILKVESGVSRKEHYSTRGQFSQLHVDFVVCERESLNVMAVIELDDRTHNAEKDKKRDGYFEQAGHKVIRYPSKNKPTVAQIEAQFAQLLGTDNTVTGEGAFPTFGNLSAMPSQSGNF